MGSASRDECEESKAESPSADSACKVPHDAQARANEILSRYK